MWKSTQARLEWGRRYWPAYRERHRDDPEYKAKRASCQQRYRAANPERARNYERKQRAQWRRNALAAYGNKCACCGEEQYEFLVIDHVNNDGAEHRAKNNLNGSSAIYKWLRKNDYPEGFQVLCHNCNMAKGFYGQCPHSKT